MPKTAKPTLTEDEIRIDILEYLYDAWKNPIGMDSHKLKISKITSDLKKKGIEKKYVVRNLIYLIETGWVNEEVKESQFFTGKMRIPTEKKSYRISKDGIDYFEGSSKFQKSNKLAGISMNDIKNSVIIVGDNNVVRNEYKDLFEVLEDLGRQIRINSQLSNEEKLEYQAEVDTIEAQIKKSEPDKSILKTSWGALEKLSTVAGIVEIIEKVRPFILKLIGL